MSYKGFQCAIVETTGKAIYSYKIHFLINLHTVALYAVEVKNLVLKCLFSAVTLQYPRKIFKCHL